MNWELVLLHTILTAEHPTQVFKQARDWGITPERLTTPEGRKGWQSLLDFYLSPETYGKIPSQEMFAEMNRTIELASSKDDLAAIIGRISDTRILKGVTDSLDRFELDSEASSAQALDSMIDRLVALRHSTSRRKDAVWSEAFLDIARDIQDRSKAGGITGIHTPWPTLTAATTGINLGDLWLLWGLPKHRKTFYLLVMAAYAAAMGERVLMYSGEMTWEKSRMRLAAINTRTDYARLMSSALSVAEQFDMMDSLRRVMAASSTETGGNIVFTDCRRSDREPAEVDDLKDKIEEHGATICFVDSAYMLKVRGTRDSMDWKSHAARTASLKQIAKDTGVPMVAGLQTDLRSAVSVAKSGGEDMDGALGIAGYNMVIQDADVGINVVTDKAQNLTSLRIAVGRETDHPGVTIESILCQSFAERPDIPVFNLKDVIERQAAARAEREGGSDRSSGGGSGRRSRESRSTGAQMRERILRRQAGGS